jgi:hypothetical protein
LPRPINIAPKNLRELQKAMKYMETAIEPGDVRPILVRALMIFHAKALELLRRLTKRAIDLPPDWEHIEDAFIVQEGKSYSRNVARAFAKIFRKAAPQAVWIEFGHRIVSHEPGKKDSGKYVNANPFFRPAINITRKEVLKTVRDGVRVLLQIAATKAGFSGQG